MNLTVSITVQRGFVSSALHNDVDTVEINYSVRVCEHVETEQEMVEQQAIIKSILEKMSYTFQVIKILLLRGGLFFKRLEVLMQSSAPGTFLLKLPNAI